MCTRSNTEPEVASVPDVGFAESRGLDGFDLLLMDDLVRRGPTLDHRPDRPHRVAFYQLVHVREGRGTHMIDFTVHPLEPGCIAFVGEGDVQAFDLASPMQGEVLLLTSDRLTSTLGDASLGHLWGLFNPHVTPSVLKLPESDRSQIADQIAALRDELFSPMVPDRQEMLRAMLRLLLLRLHRGCRAANAQCPQASETQIRLFTQFVAEVEARSTESRNASDFARWIGVSYKRLNHLCRTFTGRTAKRFIDDLVILECKRILATSDLSVSEIGYRFGFEEPTNFVKYFKTHAGSTPLRFRQTSGTLQGRD